MRPELKTIDRLASKARRSHIAYEDAVRAAVAAGCPKIEVARAAGISRPTLDKLLKKEDDK